MRRSYTPDQKNRDGEKTVEKSKKWNTVQARMFVVYHRVGQCQHGNIRSDNHFMQSIPPFAFPPLSG